jgi:hypothetical protein
MERILRGIAFSVLFYIGALIGLGAVAGGIAGYREPHNAATAGRIAGEEMSRKYGKLIGYTAIAVGVFSAFAGSSRSQECRGY